MKRAMIEINSNLKAIQNVDILSAIPTKNKSWKDIPLVVVRS